MEVNPKREYVAGLYLKKTDRYDADTTVTFLIKIMRVNSETDIEILEITVSGSIQTFTNKTVSIYHLNNFDMCHSDAFNIQANKIILKLLA